MFEFANDAGFDTPTPTEMLSEAGLDRRAIDEVLRRRRGVGGKREEDERNGAGEGSGPPFAATVVNIET